MVRSQPASSVRRASGCATVAADIERRQAETTRAPVLADLVTASDLGAAWDALSLAKRRAVVDVLITVTILPTGRGGRAFKPESVRIEWKDDTVT